MASSPQFVDKVKKIFKGDILHRRSDVPKRQN
jgi:hypothetical protein